MALSKALNNINKTSLTESQFLIIAQQVRAIWRDFGSPLQKNRQLPGSLWKVSSGFSSFAPCCFLLESDQIMQLMQSFLYALICTSNNNLNL